MAGRSGPNSVSYIEPAQKLKWLDVFQAPAGQSFSNSSGMGINSMVAFEFRPNTPLGFAEVNDVRKLNSRKDWIVGVLKPFARTRAAAAEWKAATHALFGDQNFIQLKGNPLIRGNAIPFPTEASVKQAGGASNADIRLLVLCPERGKNGWPNWLVTTDELMKGKRFHEVFQSGQLMPDGAMKSGSSRWPYTAAAVIYIEATGAAQNAPGGSQKAPGASPETSKRKLRILNILLDTTKLPVLDGPDQVAESVYQVLHGFLAFAARGTSKPGAPGAPIGSVLADGETKAEAQSDRAASRIQAHMPGFLLSGDWLKGSEKKMVAPVEALGFVRGDGGWTHNLRACSQCGVWDRKVNACSACSRVRYCSRECQKAAWGEGHKTECKEFQAAKASQGS